MKIKRIPKRKTRYALLSRQDIRDLHDALEIAIAGAPACEKSQLVDASDAERFYQAVAWRRLLRVCSKASR